MELKDILGVDDELNLYLVANGLKPAAMLTIDPRNPRLEPFVEKSERKILWVRNSKIRLKEGIIENIKELLDKTGINYEGFLEESTSRTYKNFCCLPVPVARERSLQYQISAGRDRKSLDRLLEAQTSEERGIVLGYPKEAIEAYKKVIDGERRDGSYIPVSLAKAKQAGLELPTWLAYICFVPENLDLVNGNVSESSKALAEKYQNFVRENNPELAERVEKHFFERKLPDGWEKRPDGGYAYFFKPHAKD